VDSGIVEGLEEDGEYYMVVQQYFVF